MAHGTLRFAGSHMAVYYGQCRSVENIKYCIDVESLSYQGYKETQSSNEDLNWEHDVLLLDGEKTRKCRKVLMPFCWA